MMHPPDQTDGAPKSPLDRLTNELMSDAQAILDSFYASVVACGRDPPFKPTIAISSSPGVTQYDALRGAIVLIPYDQLDGERRAAMDRFASIGLLGLDGRGQYREIFNNLLVPHELGHWVQEVAQTPLDRWQAEYNANQFMVAFWRENPASPPAHATEKRLANFTVQPPNMPDPMPAGTQLCPRSFFNSHLSEIERDPMAYAAFQKMMVRQAMSEKPAPSFRQLIEQTWA